MGTTMATVDALALGVPSGGAVVWSWRMEPESWVGTATAGSSPELTCVGAGAGALGAIAMTSFSWRIEEAGVFVVSLGTRMGAMMFEVTKDEVVGMNI